MSAGRVGFRDATSDATSHLAELEAAVDSVWEVFTRELEISPWRAVAAIPGVLVAVEVWQRAKRRGHPRLTAPGVH